MEINKYNYATEHISKPLKTEISSMEYSNLYGEQISITCKVIGGRREPIIFVEKALLKFVYSEWSVARSHTLKQRQ